MAGPFCTQLLGDMGAQIIKVESPQGGDDTRGWAPFWNGISCYYLAVNRNKKSIAADLKAPAGREIILKLVATSDVFIENFRPGAINRLGLDYETLAAINPRLIYTSLSGFGQSGPRSLEPAYDLLMQAFAGLMSLTGTSIGEPVRTGLPVTDLAEALFAAFGIVSALYRRELDGLGQKFETSLLEGQLSWLSYYIVGYFANGVVPRGLGSAHHSLAPYMAYRAQDEYFVLAVGNDSLWRRLCEAIDRPELGEDPRFAKNEDRIINRVEMDAILNMVFSQQPATEMIERIQAAGIPCGLINTIDRIITDPQVQHLGTITEVPHPEIPDLKLAGAPLHFSRTPGAIQNPPPGLGEHTRAILHELGYSAETIEALHNDQVVKSPGSS
jgi:crotonobetainyl-CoA:carnitine CoA-transferase CaiB-like acyl-CoA transferase